MKSFLLKTLKITGITAGIILVLVLSIPFLFPGLVTDRLKQWTNNNINGELNFSKAKLSFFQHFPSLTLTLYDFSLKGAKPFERDTLVSSKEIALGVDLGKLVFKRRVVIDKIFLADAYMNMEVNEKGEANYNVYISDTKKQEAAKDTASSASIRIRNIEITNCHFVYDDKSVGVLLDARGFNYTGKGRLKESLFTLQTHAAIASLDFYLDKEAYLLHKNVNADLITKINTNSFSLIFEKNKLNINNLPLEFAGTFDFLDKGYNMDFSVSSGKTTLYNLITALPPQYTTWLQKTTVKGETTIQTALKGQYIVSENRMPEFTFNMQLRNGSIAYAGAPLPASGILLNVDVKMPSLNKDSLVIKMDTVSLNAGKDYISARLTTTGLAPTLAVAGNIKAVVDLEQLDKVLGLSYLYGKGNHIAGSIKADLHFQDNQRDITKGRYDQLNNEGTLQLSNISLSSKQYFTKPFLIREGLFRFKRDRMWFNKFLANYGQSDLRMDGYLENVINYALSNKGILKGNFTLNSRLFNVDEFMVNADATDSAQVKAASTADTTGVIMIPANLDLNFKANAANVSYNGLTLQQFKGDVTLNKARVVLKETGFTMIGCTVAMNALYTGLNPKQASFDYHIQATDFDVQRAYKEVKLFHDMMPMAATAQGIISLDYSLKGDLNAAMYPVFPSLSGGGVLSLKDVQIKKFKLFNAVSDKTGTSAIKDPNLKKIDIKTTIRNNVVTLERVKLKVAGFRPRIEGQTSFDGRLALKMRLGLPPFGIIGIPLTITGTKDKPKIRLGKKTEDLSEKDDKEE